MSTGLRTRRLGCRYPGSPRPALVDVDIDVPAGSMTVVMGATGAGKSTLAACVTRIVPCFTEAEVRGEIVLCGDPIDTRRPGELAGTIGMVFQDFEAQLFSTDVTQELVFALEQTGVPPSEMDDRVTRALATVGLAGFADRDPTTLSGGEKQRLAIAGLLALRPRVLVLDEPTTDLDPAGRATVFAVLAALRREGLALLVIEHDVGAAALADQLVLLAEGRVLAAGPPARLLADVDRCRAAGVRPPDVGRVFAALGIPDPPLDVDAAAERLRSRGFASTAVRDHHPPPSSPRPLLTVEGVTHRWPDGSVALDDVHLAIGGGELVALVGHNGAGKTTLAKHLNGLLAPTLGTVRLEGSDVASLPLERIAQRVGFVFQDPDHQLFASTVTDEIAFGPRNVGLSETEIASRVGEALAAVGLHARDADPFLLDKGARQRLAVASVLALHPDVLVLDEPLTGLDHAEQQRMLALLRMLHGAGRTIVMITHTPWVIAEYAERVVLMAGGRVRYDGPVRAFFADETLVAAAAFRAPDVTRLGGRLGRLALTVEELVEHLRRGPGS